MNGCILIQEVCLCILLKTLQTIFIIMNLIDIVYSLFILYANKSQLSF